MSAQIIGALRLRAAMLETEAEAISGQAGGGSELPVSPGQVPRNQFVLRTIAAEFRQLADIAEGLQ